MKKRSENPGAGAARLVAAAALLVSLGACGGDKGVVDTCQPPQIGSPPNCMDPPEPCKQSLIEEDSGGVPSMTIVFNDFSVPEDGRLDVTLDWTNPESRMAFYLVPAGTCQLEELNARSCQFLIQTEPSNTPKPFRLSTEIAAGNYRWLVGNAAGDTESAALQIVLSTGDCEAFVGAPPSAAAQGALDEPIWRQMQK
jgi:hypothetical protein